MTKIGRSPSQRWIRLAFCNFRMVQEMETVFCNQHSVCVNRLTDCIRQTWSDVRVKIRDGDGNADRISEWDESQVLLIWYSYVGFLNWGYPNSWMVFVNGKIPLKWMMNRSTPISGNLHMSLAVILFRRNICLPENSPPWPLSIAIKSPFQNVVQKAAFWTYSVWRTQSGAFGQENKGAWGKFQHGVTWDETSLMISSEDTPTWLWNPLLV